MFIETDYDNILTGFRLIHTVYKDIVFFIYLVQCNGVFTLKMFIATDYDDILSGFRLIHTVYKVFRRERA
uniref:Uncharacterized protein n=1 Tax=Acrobeloides nanus TaxID=290746 RepID=A0A914DQL2_9BILA